MNNKENEPLIMPTSRDNFSHQKQTLQKVRRQNETQIKEMNVPYNNFADIYVHRSHHSTPLKKESNNSNYQLHKEKNESNIKRQSISQPLRNKYSIQRTQQSRVTLKHSHTNENANNNNNHNKNVNNHFNNNNNNSIKNVDDNDNNKDSVNNNDDINNVSNNNNRNNNQIKKSSSQKNKANNHQRSMHTCNKNHPQALNLHSSENLNETVNSPRISPNSNQDTEQTSNFNRTESVLLRENSDLSRTAPQINQTAIPRINFSNLPSFESEPEYQLQIMAPRFRYCDRHEFYRGTSNGFIDFMLTPSHPKTSRRTNDVKDLLIDYTISLSDEKNKLCCTICLCEFKKSEKTAKLKCGHVFHKNCVLSWFNKGPSDPVCPMCRQNLRK